MPKIIGSLTPPTLLLILLTGHLSACIPAAQPGTPSLGPGPTSTTTPYAGPAPTIIAPRATGSILPVATATVITSETQTNSLGVVPCIKADTPLALRTGQHLPGVLAFRLQLDLVLLKGATLEERNLLDLASLSRWEIIGLTPNGKWLAYTTEDPGQNHLASVHLISLAGEEISHTPTSFPAHSDPSQAYPWGAIAWINDDLLLVSIFDGDSESLAVLNPFTGSWHEELLDSLPNRFPQGGVAFSPDLTRALYVALVGDRFRITLWDISDNKPLWSQGDYDEDLMIYNNKLVSVAWSPDSMAVAFTHKQVGDMYSQFYVLDRNGTSIQAVRPNTKDNRASSVSWSLDSRYLVALMPLGDSSDPLLTTKSGIVIYDKATQANTIACSNEVSSHNIETGRLIWSPDGRYLVYGRGTDQASENNAVVMQDLHTGEVTLLQRGPRIILIGWSPADTWAAP